MFRKFLHIFGIHNWHYYLTGLEDDLTKTGAARECKICPRIQNATRIGRSTIRWNDTLSR